MSQTRPESAEACAGANIAIVKYWGKRDVSRNLPAGSSLSLTLRELETTTRVSFTSQLTQDDVQLGGEPAPPVFARRVSKFLDRIRRLAGLKLSARVQTANSFPTAAGLASSASGFAALAVAACRAAGLTPGIDQLATLARLGSGSATRSLLGGFVELQAGTRSDGADCRVRELGDAADWPLNLLVAVVGEGPKSLSSTAGMQHTVQSSPLYPAFLEANAADLPLARDAVTSRDLQTLGKIAERSCLRMHAAAAGAAPGVLYFRGPTVELIHAVRRARNEGLYGYFTIDAGPHVKVLCESDAVDALRERLLAVDGVSRVLVASPGPGARTVDPEQVDADR
ncbi:MAG: diphosphomevalonate decarboxylase [Deltaproteobacteria bacterium]|nr:diphosphomevalonate decarboxylase [Deltaproteobacteria bacterium]